MKMQNQKQLNQIEGGGKGHGSCASVPYQALNILPDPLFMVDTQGKLCFVNPAFCSLFDKKKDQLIGCRPRDKIHWFREEKTESWVKSLCTSPCQENFQQQVTAPDGLRWLEWKHTVILDSQEDITAVLVSGWDITAKKRATDALEESKIKYRAIIDSMEDLVAICSPDFRIEFMNRAMIKRIGDDATGKICWKALHGFDGPCPWCSFENTMAGNSTLMEILSPLDSNYYYRSSSPILCPDGSVTQLTVYRNITSIRKMKERIQQAQKMEAIGNLAGGIAHDFNNILFPIVASAEMLMEDLMPESPEHEFAKRIFSAGRRGGDLVRQILSFSRRTEHKKVLTRVQQVMKEVLRLVHATLPSSITISSNLQKECGQIMADPTQLHQIGMNLITNAYHAIEDGIGKIDVQVREVDLQQGDLSVLELPAGDYIMLSVSDTGTGILPEVMGKIFEPYFTTKSKDKGTGLGLAMVYSIVKEHQGDIRVYSEPGIGTTFNIYLPLAKTQAVNVEKKEKKEIATASRRILLVDDETSVMKLEKLMLERLGHKVIAYTRSPEALAAFQDDPEAFDLVVSDMTMPEMTGDALAEQLLDSRPDIPIIICTGFSERINAESVSALGIKYFLMKPLTSSELARAIQRVFNK